jgi:hypothetical protein
MRPQRLAGLEVSAFLLVVLSIPYCPAPATTSKLYRYIVGLTLKTLYNNPTIGSVIIMLGARRRRKFNKSPRLACARPELKL